MASTGDSQERAAAVRKSALIFDQPFSMGDNSGSDAFCVIRSAWETSKLNGQNPFDTLRLAFAA